MILTTIDSRLKLTTITTNNDWCNKSNTTNISNEKNDGTINNNRIERHKSRLLQSFHSVTSGLQHVRSSGQGSIVCKSRATQRPLIACNMPCATWHDGKARLL